MPNQTEAKSDDVIYPKNYNVNRPAVYINVFIQKKFKLNDDIYFESQKFGQSRRVEFDSVECYINDTINGQNEMLYEILIYFLNFHVKLIFISYDVLCPTLCDIILQSVCKIGNTGSITVSTLK